MFAIAITLLVLQLIEMPEPPVGEELLPSLLHTWERFFAFAVGLCTTLVCWINHHYMFEYIRRSDSGLPWVTGFLFLLVAFIPFPTAIIAQYIDTERTATFALSDSGSPCAPDRIPRRDGEPRVPKRPAGPTPSDDQASTSTSTST